MRGLCGPARRPSARRRARRRRKSSLTALATPSDDAYTAADLVGGAAGAFAAGGRAYRRTDFAVDVPAGVAGTARTRPSDPGDPGREPLGRLQASLYERSPPNPAAPVVVYAHCNSGSRRDADEVLGLLLPRGAAVVAFDARGSGLSTGSVVSLGATEAVDLAAIVAHVRLTRPGCRVAVWGRSMGAVAALTLAASRAGAPLAAVVADSPFASLPDLMRDLATSRSVPLPRLLAAPALALMRRSVRKRAGFDVRAVAPVLTAPSATPPALFGHADADSFIPVAHTKRLHAAYGGVKALCTFGGDHNSARPPVFHAAAAAFLDAALGTGEPAVSFVPAAALAAAAAFDAAVAVGGRAAPGAAASAHAAAEAAWGLAVPVDVRALPPDDAERMMVEEAIRASLVVADSADGGRSSAGRSRSGSGDGLTPDQRALHAFFSQEGGGNGGDRGRGGWPAGAPAPAPPPAARASARRALMLPKNPPRGGRGAPTEVRATTPQD